MLRLEQNWSLTEAIKVINSLYTPGGMTSGSTRNRQIEAWGQIVGRSRALAELEAAIALHGSTSAFLRQIQMSRSSLYALREFWESLPDDKPRKGPYAGLSISGNMLIERLGSGAHSDVWRVRNTWGKLEAMKILRKPSSYSLKRFADEIAVLEQIGKHPGVLPLISRSDELRQKKADYYWLTMPIAMSVREAVTASMAPTTVLSGIRSIAETLRDLHNADIFHRDIKPDNIFVWKKRWVLGDFGIASFPKSASLTLAHHRLGPLHFHAPEMLESPDVSEGAPADIYSLAKTMWVLLAGTSYPPPGEIRRAVPEMTLTRWCPISGIEALDELIEKATKHVANQRIGIDEFVETILAISQ